MPVSLAGQRSSASIWPARKRRLQSRQSTIGSWKFATWPDATQVCGLAMIDESSPTTSSRSRTMVCHHAAFTFARSSTPIGP